MSEKEEGCDSNKVLTTVTVSGIWRAKDGRVQPGTFLARLVALFAHELRLERGVDVGGWAGDHDGRRGRRRRGRDGSGETQSLYLKPRDMRRKEWGNVCAHGKNLMKPSFD